MDNEQPLFPDADSDLVGTRSGVPFALIWPPLVLTILFLDYLAGPIIHFPVTFLIPIGLATWLSGRRWGYSLAVLFALTRIFFYLSWEVERSELDLALNAGIRLVVFILFVYMLSWIRDHVLSLQREVRLLSGLLPICSYCKKIRDKEQHWQSLERYISDHSEASFSHGICPECLRQHFPEFAEQHLKKL
ncbi:MAG: hypothetical protein KDD64_14600 [Bdellovibrionales bacterium]|nr:hypothetical protein [Bdellovibrionales bacterium]